MAEGWPPRGEFLDVLYVGQCEPLKAVVHGVLMGSVALCALYNAAAWLRRREHHLGLNAMIYGGAVLWEYIHVQQHLACLPVPPAVDTAIDKVDKGEDDPLPDAA